MTRKRTPRASLHAVRNNLSGLDNLYRPATEAERIIDEHREGATWDELQRKYPDRDVYAILRRHVGGES